MWRKARDNGGERASVCGGGQDIVEFEKRIAIEMFLYKMCEQDVLDIFTQFLNNKKAEERKRMGEMQRTRNERGRRTVEEQRAVESERGRG